jgi:hypothetical protein
MSSVHYSARVCVDCIFDGLYIDKGGFISLSIIFSCLIKNDREGEKRKSITFEITSRIHPIKNTNHNNQKSFDFFFDFRNKIKLVYSIL